MDASTLINIVDAIKGIAETYRRHATKNQKVQDIADEQDSDIEIRDKYIKILEDKIKLLEQHQLAHGHC